MTRLPTVGWRRAVGAANVNAVASVASGAATMQPQLSATQPRPRPRLVTIHAPIHIPCRSHSRVPAYHTPRPHTCLLSSSLPRARTMASSSSSAASKFRSAPFSARLREAVRQTRADYPIMFPVLLVAAAVSVSVLGLVAWDEYTRVAPAYSAYPTPVEQRLRLALHYTYISPDPDTASQYFREAIEVAEGVGMDPLSKEYIGLRIRYAECLEKYGRVKAAIKVLDHLTTDLEHALASLEEEPSSSVSTVDQAATATATMTTNATATPQTTESSQKRQELLKRIIQNKVKIASLYDGEYVQDRASAKQILSAAIQLLVSKSLSSSEGLTRERIFLSTDNAANLSLAEMAAILSQMGDLYATSGEEANAVQTYMLALPTVRASCNGSRSCKEAQLLSNVAATMYQALKKPNAKINGQPASKNPKLVQSARVGILKWADQAIATVERISQDQEQEQQPEHQKQQQQQQQQQSQQEVEAERAEDKNICFLSLLSAKLTKAHVLLESADAANKAEAGQILTWLLPIVRERAGGGAIQETVEDALKRATATATDSASTSTATASTATRGSARTSGTAANT